MKIYFARHGQTDWNVQGKIQGTTDIPLNDTGIKQAEQLAQTLKDRNIKLTKVYSSNLRRAQRTAQAVCGRYGIECETLEGLQEISFGVFEGYTWEEIRTNFPEIFGKWCADKRYFPIPEGESNQLVLERVFRALDTVEELRAENSSDGAILIVTHGGVLKSMLTVLKGIPFEDNSSLEVPNATPVEFSAEELAAIKNKL